jgi:hypothetical protein
MTCFAERGIYAASPFKANRALKRAETLAPKENLSTSKLRPIWNCLILPIANVDL